MNNLSHSPFNFKDFIESKDLNLAIIDLDSYLNKKCNYGEEIQRLTPPEFIFVLNQNYEREINNGGIHQFFANSSGDFSLETVSSLNKIYATYNSNLISEMIKCWPNEVVPKDHEERNNILTKIETNCEPIWDKLENDFFKYHENLNQLNFDFVKENIQYFS